MNDNTSFERYVAQAFDREGQGRPVPGAIHDDLISRAGRQRQWPTWLASIKEPPMRLDNHTAVGSPTVRVVAVLATTVLLTLLLAAAGIAGQRLFAASADYTVDAAGNGDFTTIAEAVAVAQDGESILVRNGTYTESLTITNDISLVGESRDGVIVEFGAGCRFEGDSEFWWENERICDPDVMQLEGTEFWPKAPYALHLEDSDASVSDLTFRHLFSGYGIYVRGGAPMIERVTYADNGADSPNGANNIMLRRGTSATVKDSDLGMGSVGSEEASPVTVEGNTLGAVLTVAPRDEASGGPGYIRNNTMRGMIWADGLHVIEGNEIDLTDDEFESAGIFVGLVGDGWVVRDNTVLNSKGLAAIDIAPGVGVGEIVGNTLEGNKLGISVQNNTRVEGNTVIDGTTGIRVAGSEPEVIGNTVEGMERVGFDIGFGAPTLSDNVGCGSATDLLISQGADDAVIDESNEFCVVNDMRAE